MKMLCRLFPFFAFLAVSVVLLALADPAIADGSAQA